MPSFFIFALFFISSPGSIFDLLFPFDIFDHWSVFMIKQQKVTVKFFRLLVGNFFQTQFSENKKAPAKMQVPALSNTHLLYIALKSDFTKLVKS